MADALEKLIADNTWRPIEDAPKDGSVLVLTAPGITHHFIGKWVKKRAGRIVRNAEGKWHRSTGNGTQIATWRSKKDGIIGFEPTHFRPLPDDRLALACRELVEALPNITYQSSVKRREEMLHNALARANAIAKGETQPTKGETNDQQ